MNPNVDSPPSMHLPEPLPASSEQVSDQLSQTGAEAVGSQALGQQSPLAPTSQQATNGFTQNPVAGASQTDLVANDDKIEKEWIVRVKQIIASTSHDPYAQNKQLAAFKAEYIQKRYNKTIELSE